ncbi:CHASE2 domain-containing protein [Microcoleus sp. FACHB-68]|uniref:adenylate/guanylate cyclase domain-containing protein n=1 Tax=Microcoleus sp. FACHB-68 TaxID=2692826 RepID=UPI001689BEAD|nr:CHASE2 domain-containing protein [Microcoleus sp. FACHB-68]MBD1938101.1 CHASE2 domain-containing protein [Microcoleus sp. FACHB-68]
MGRKLSKRIWQWRGVLMIAPSVAGLVIAANSFGLFQLLEWATLDKFFRLRPREPVDPRIVIVTIDEADIDRLEQWPMSDAKLAKLIENLKKQQPLAIGIDLYRNLPVRPGHDALVKVYQSTPNLIGVEKLVGETVAPPVILKQQDQVGLADLVLDADGKVRRGLLSVKPNEKEPSQLSLAVRLALIYLKEKGIGLEMVDAGKMHLKLGKALFVPLKGNEGGYAGLDAGGYQILLNYRGTQDSFKSISLTDALANRIDPNSLRDRIVLIGVTGQSFNDFFLTPYGNSFTGSPSRTPGVVIHANLTSQILSAALEGRPFIKVWDEPVEWLWVLGWSFTGASMSWTLLVSKLFRKNLLLRWTVLGIGILLPVTILMSSSYIAFLLSWWIPSISPLVALLLSGITIAAYYNRGVQRESERKLSQFLEAMSVAVAVLDSSGRPCYTNQKAQQLLGQGVIDSATVDQLSEVYQLYIAGTDQLYPSEKLSVVRALRGERATVHDIEIHREGKIIPIETWGTPIFDDTGNVAYAIVAFQDITERKQSEAEREKFTKQLFELNRNLEKALDAELEITDAYGRFVPHEFLNLLGYESILDAKLGDNIQLEMTVLFSDIRDFTSLSETMTPEDNFKFINAYLSRMEPAITENYGFIDKYIGDAIMALFSEGADDALRAAISMLTKLAEYNQARIKAGYIPIQIGIGINTGFLMLGTVGSNSRMNGTVISDAVNLASRIEGLTKTYGVSLLISGQTFLALKNPCDYAFRLIDKVKVKGKSQMVTVYEIFDADPAEIKEAKLQTKTTFEKALLLYNLGRFWESAQQFQSCLKTYPEDRVAQSYLERCRQQIIEGSNQI